MPDLPPPSTPPCTYSSQGSIAVMSLPASLHEQIATYLHLFVTVIRCSYCHYHLCAISSLTTPLSHTTYPLTVRLRTTSRFFLTHIAYATYPNTTACLLMMIDTKVKSICNRTYVVTRRSLANTPLNSRYCALRPTVCLPSLSTGCTRGHVTAAPSCQARLLTMES